MSLSVTPAQPPAAPRPSPLAWLGAELALSSSSAAFYQQAVRQPVARALFFFVLLACGLTTLQALGLLIGLAQAGYGLWQSFETGDFPVITIENGVASTTEHRPYVFVDDGVTMAVIDVTGRHVAINPNQYRQGILLTRTRLVILNQQGQLQRLPLSDLNAAFNRDPLVIDGALAAQGWAIVSVVVLIVMVLLYLTWHLLLRLIYLLLLALPMWGAAALLRPGTDYGKVLITGVYALLPALAAVYLIGFEFRFPGMFTLLFGTLWGVGLYLAVRPGPPRPLRAWRALLALPLLLYLAADLVFGWHVWWVGWPLAALTVGALAAAGLWPRLAATAPAPVA